MQQRSITIHVKSQVISLGAINKGARNQGGFTARTFFRQGGEFRSGRPHFLVQKLRIFQTLSVRTKGVEPVRTFFGQEGGVNFSLFCVSVFYGRPLKVGLYRTRPRFARLV